MKIALLGCKGTTLDLLHALSPHVDFDYVITLPEEIARRNNVAFYQSRSILDYCRKKNIPTYMSSSYHLRDEADIRFFKSSGIDLLLVIGWERLIPEEILRGLGKYACGMHGSPFGLPKGRGRSPLNWSLITDKKRFITYLFRYKPGMDDGDIIGFRAFDVNAFDTITSLHQKNRIIMGELFLEYLPQIRANLENFFPQPPGKPSFYPKRAAKDGFIDWRQSTKDIYNLIRAVSFPYPSAFTYLGEKKITIHDARPFDTLLFHGRGRPGEILDVSIAAGNFVVKSKDGSIIVNRFDGAAIEEIKAGEILKSSEMEKIFNEIRGRYPDWVQDDQKEI